MLKELLIEQTGNEIVVQGFGTMDIDTAKRGVISRLESALSKIKNNPDSRDWANAKHIIFDAGVVQNMLTAVVKNSDN